MHGRSLTLPVLGWQSPNRVQSIILAYVIKSNSPEQFENTMKSAIKLREKLQRKELTIGIIVTHHLWLEMLEVAQFAGLDYIIVDLEHVSHGDTLVTDACRMGRMLDFPVIVRPPCTEPETVRLAMDLGPCGLLLPMMQSVEQLNRACEGIWMPPRGQRRPGGHGNWWVEDFNYTTWKREVEDNFIVLTQIESPQGVANARAIAAHEVTTALAVGPYDLSARLGVCWNPDAPELQDALSAIRQAADDAGKPMWMIGDGAALRKKGYNFLCIAEPMYLLRATLKNMVDSLRAGSDGDEAKAFVP